MPLPRSIESPFESLVESDGSSAAAAAGSKSDSLGYETFYGLHEPPFTLSSDPKFFYHSTPHDYVAQQLLTAIRNRDGMVVLTGDIGTGKTTLCRAVIEQLDRRTLTSLVSDAFVPGEELLKTILADFGVMSREELARGPLATPHDLSATLTSFIESLAPLQASAVVIIDEAQNLPPDVLEQVRILSESGKLSGLLQIILVGQPSLEALLRRLEFRPISQLVTLHCKLMALPADEIESYVMHRLAVAGSTPRVRLDAAAIAHLYRLSQGVPRVVNLLCHRALARGHEASAGVIDLDLLETAAEDLDIGVKASAVRGALRLGIAAIGLVLLVLIGAATAAWVFRDAVGRSIVRWELRPSNPPAPLRHLPAPAPGSLKPDSPAAR